MVGHTSVYDTAIKAITATDKALGTIYDACEKAGYILMITADHGNAEQTINLEIGASHTAHTMNTVLFILTGKGHEFVTDDEEGRQDRTWCSLRCCTDRVGRDGPFSAQG